MAMEKNSPQTMKDIARELGVSVSTVSRALKGNSHISKAKREEIQQFARVPHVFPIVKGGLTGLDDGHVQPIP